MDSDQDMVRGELYFLVAKFLANGPCQRTAKVLLEELADQRLLCQRLDWRGNYHPQTYQDMVLQNTHIPDDYLVQICCRLGPLLEKCIPSGVKGIQSLLCTGRNSLLRTGSETVKTTMYSLAASNHDAPLLPPSGKRLCPNLGQSILSREISGFRCKSHLAQPNTYSKQTMHRRILGHLSAVYCVLFDRTGHCIITGADDSLVKIWSTRDGHLLATLRGHNAEITDIAINCENTLVAAGSCDKLIRVWSLKTTYPVAILQGHTGMITSLAFCPSPLKESRYLMSTGADGTVCFWKWEAQNLTFESTPVRFMEKTRPGTQMVCSSFSPGGSFLVAGSTDHIIRLYQLTPGPPEKIAELDVHVDHVDSIQFSHKGEKFLSGSKDGTARIWYFKRSKWENILLDISKTLNGSPSIDDLNRVNKPRVTMVSWDLWDHHVVTAINDHTIKVWNSCSGNLVHILEGHHDEMFVLEAHPIDPFVFLSAGHDGLVILWDLRTGKKITSFFNSIEGQGHGAVFDCKFSPDGLQFACTDSHGHLCIFGYGSSEPFSKVPSEQFFHTDYRPLIRDANHYVLDEQTQTAPHLMPPPFLVDVDGNPHPLHYQRLVPGHGSNVRNAQPPPPMPRLEDAPFLAEIEQAENRGRIAIQVPGSPANQVEGQAPPLQSPGGSRNYGMRQSGDIEGVRQAQGNVPVIEDVAESDIALWRRRVIVPDIKSNISKSDEERRLFLGKNELTNYLREKKKRPQATVAVRLVNQSIQESLSHGERGQQGHSSQRRTSSRQAARARSRESRVRRVANRVSSRSTYATRSALAMDIDESGEEDIVALTPTDSEEEEEEWTGSSSESSEYSDWTEDVGLRSSSQNESRRSRRVRRVLSTSDEDNEPPPTGSSSPQPNGSKREKKSKKPSKPKKLPKKPKLDEVQDILNYYQPPDWIMCTKPRLSPYVPQIGDEVYYFRQGHEKYVKEVMRHRLYDINPKKQCYYKLRLKGEELCRIVSLHFSLYNGHPPTLCCIKLAQINAESLMTGGTFTVKYHDMADVLDFIVLRQHYERSLTRNWQAGNRFRSVIDESWWAGMITERSPYQTEFPESHFQCLEVRWDTGETERMSPWDLESVADNDPGNYDSEASNQDASGAFTSNIPLTDEDRQELSYEPTELDWLGEGREEMTQRIMSCIESLYQLSMAGPFVYPVDVQTYPDYWSIVPFPIDLSTIMQKLENRFYRRANALIWDIKLIERNARLFNEEDSQIVRNSTQLVRVLIEFIRDKECTDILSLCGGVDDEQGEIEVTHVSEESDNGDDEGPSDRGKRKKPDKNSSNKRVKLEEPEEASEEMWIISARELLQFLMSREDAEPFQAPVNLNDFPDYLEFVQEPMDFSTVSEKLESNTYADPDSFVRDVRLIFSNSRAYNTVPRSRIYSMTIRLSAMFEDRVDSILSEWYASASGGARRTRLRTQQLLQSGERTSYRVIPHDTTSNTEDSSQYRVVSQSSNMGDHLRTTIRLPQTRHNSRGDENSGRVPPIRISVRTVAETSPRQDTLPEERRRPTRQAGRTDPGIRTRNATRNETLVNGSLTHQYSTRRRSARLMSEESQDGEEEEEEEESQNSDGRGEDEDEDESEEESEEEESEDSEEEEEDSPVTSRPSRRSNIRPKIRPTAVPRASRSSDRTRKTSASSSNQRAARTRKSSSASADLSRQSSRTRSRRVTYTETDSDSDSEMVDVSSRGRVRRPTQRMLDYIE